MEIKIGKFGFGIGFFSLLLVGDMVVRIVEICKNSGKNEPKSEEK